MVDTLLSTKLYIPHTREGAVARPRLVEKLLSTAKQTGSFILLSGPAGFGKTTLLCEFVAQIRQPVAWLSLDDGDNDPIRFWNYLVAACQPVYPGLGESALDRLKTGLPLSDDTIPAMLINDMASQDRSILLVLDDYHAIQNPSLHSGIAFLLDHLPNNLHPIISTRTDPPWPLARYRARNQLIEIRAQELRFTLEEATEFLGRTMGLILSPEQLGALEERTEGWVAGLQLAALSMRGRSDIGSFIRAFTGSHVYIAEYLIDEVLERQPDDMQAFLLKTSILERLTARLCEAITGCTDGQGKLKALQQANIFIAPLDDDDRWFRYHHLFADLLRARLHSSVSKAQLNGLHQQASAWYEQSGMMAEGIEHALAGEDYACAVRLVEGSALPMIIQAYVRTVESWLRAIPPVFYEQSPRVLMAYAWLNLLRGTHLQAVPYVDRLRTIFSTAELGRLDPSLRGEWLAIQSEYLIAQGKPEESRDLANQAKNILPDVNPLVRSMIYVTLAKSYQLCMDYDQAADVFQMIVRDARQIGDAAFEILGISGEAQMTLKQGYLHRTYKLANEGILRLETSGMKTPFSATLYGEMGEVHFYWHQLDQARAYLRRSMEISGKSGYSDPEIYYHLMLAKAAQMEGDMDGLAREIQMASDLAGIIPPAMIRENVISQQVRADLAMDRPDHAQKLLEPEGFSFREAFQFPALGQSVRYEAGLLYNSALRILLYHASKKLDRLSLKRGIDLGEQVFLGEFRCQHLPIALETLLLLSQMYAVLGDNRQSLLQAAKALELAEPEGFISVFVEEGKPVAEILAELLENNMLRAVRPEYVQQILTAFPAGYKSQPKSRHLPVTKVPAKEGMDESQPLVEPLSPRELEVLHLISDGDSNQTIAEKLVITVSAVKKHTGNIYGKLGVKSRTQAISRAHQLGLISPRE